MDEDYQARLVAGSTHLGDEGQEFSLRPQSFDELVGQSKLVNNLKVYVAAALERGEALDHTLLAGPPGLGKTTIAHLLANELGVDLHVTSGPVIERKDLAGILSHLKERDVLFIDEIHRLSPVVEENLYPAMEDFKFDIILGGGAHARSIEMPLPRFTLVGATTRSGLLTGPMRDRFGIAGRMEYYTHEELTQVVTRSAKILDVVCDPQGAVEIARRSRGTPRIANRLLRRVRDFAQVKGNGEVDLEMAQYALERLQIDEHGFDEMDRKLLSTLIHKFGGGPVGVETLAAAMGEEPDTLESVYEPYLLQEGFIQRTPRGRMATANSYSYLGVTPPTHAVGQGKLFQISGDQDAHKSA